MARLDEEAQWLRDEEVAALLCDAPAVPLLAARRAGVPGLLLVNFTWADIYEPYARAAGGDARRLVADLRFAYRQATAVFRAEPALRMAWLPGQINVGMVANPGRDRRKELHRILGLEREREAGLFLHRPVRTEPTSTGRGSRATPPGASTSSATTPRRSAA